jgi:hypothetical protein
MDRLFYAPHKAFWLKTLIDKSAGLVNNYWVILVFLIANGLISQLAAVRVSAHEGLLK